MLDGEVTSQLTRCPLTKDLITEFNVSAARSHSPLPPRIMPASQKRAPGTPRGPLVSRMMSLSSAAVAEHASGASFPSNCPWHCSLVPFPGHWCMSSASTLLCSLQSSPAFTASICPLLSDTQTSRPFVRVVTEVVAVDVAVDVSVADMDVVTELVSVELPVLVSDELTVRLCEVVALLVRVEVTEAEFVVDSVLLSVDEPLDDTETEAVVEPEDEIVEEAVRDAEVVTLELCVVISQP